MANVVAKGNAMLKGKILDNIPKKIPTVAESSDWLLKKMAGMKPTDILTPDKKSSLIRCAMAYGGAFIALIITSITIYIASTDDKALTEGFFKYMVFIIGPIVIACYLVLPIFDQRVSMKTLAMNGFIALVLAGSLYTYYNTKHPASILFARYAVYGIAFLSVIVGMALAFKVFYRYISNARGWFGIFFQVLFFLPCLLSDAIDYLMADFRSAPSTITILVILEVILIGLFFVYPKITALYSYYFPSKTASTVILGDPVYFNKETTLADYKLLTLENAVDNPFLQKYRYRRVYTVSFWAYLNNDNDNSPKPIFRLGDKTEQGGKPLIMYTTGGNYDMYLTNQGATSTDSLVGIPTYSTNLPGQKWNYFVFSYDSNHVDIFINGNLEKTVKLDVAVLPTYGPSDIIVSGMSNDGFSGYWGYDAGYGTKGASGALCNVNYHPTLMSQRDIITEYNKYMYSNPPTP